MRRFLDSLRRARTRRGERGQMLIIFVMVIVPVTAALGVVAVDASMWQSERRGAQKDADHSALAGAFQLIIEQNKVNAENAAIEYADFNDESGNANAPVPGSNADVANTVVVDDACFPGNDILSLNAVTVNLDHDSRGFFSDFFGTNFAPNVGAHARACAGSLDFPLGVRPFIVSITESPCFTDASGIYLPDYGATCTLDFGAHTDTEGFDHPGGNRGVADLQVSAGECSDVPSSGDIENYIENGAPGGVACGTQTGTTCTSPFVNCVVGQTGNVANATIDGIAAMLANEGACDAEYDASPDGVDDFDDALELISGPGGNDPDNLYSPRPCNTNGDTSPRLITIFAVDHWEGSNVAMPTMYFLTVYVEGCQPRSKPFSVDCSGNISPNGQVEIHGKIIKAFTAQIGQAGAPNAGGSFVITLDE